MSRPIPQEVPLLPTGQLTVAWRRFMQWVSVLMDDVVQYQPSVAATTGSITTAYATARYQRIGKQIVLSGNVQVTTNGTGAGALVVTLPNSALYAPYQTAGTGFQDTTPGKPMLVTMGLPLTQYPHSYTALQITNTDGTYPAAGTKIYFSIVYEVS